MSPNPLRAALVLLAAVAAAGCGERAPSAGAARGARAVPVTVATVEQRDVPRELPTTGIVTPLAVAEVRPQIAAVIERVHVREGESVAAGAPLFTLDASTQVAQLAKAEADLGRNSALLEDAERTLERNRDLATRRLVAQSALDSSAFAVKALRAQVQSDRAAIAEARVNVDHSTITAPSAGRVGEINWHAGSLVQPSVTPPLLVITQTDPISVAFTLPERELPALRDALAAGVTVPVSAREPQSGERLQGRLSFIDSSVDSASGTIRLKATFANPQARLWPGQYVEVRVRAATDRGAHVLPLAAVQNGQNGPYLYVIGADATVTQRPVRLLRVVDDLALIDGAEAGERVVLEGAVNLRPGGKVREAPAEGAKS